ncbi:MAG: 50S ribosomal protein L22 [Planctomycetes bacterium]|nr:50S ribosomal protein L22 [Planctomycetota bacterium]
MPFQAAHRFAPISARKARYVVDLIRRKDINEALDILKFTQKRAAPMVRKVVRAAMAAADEAGADVDSLIVFTAKADDGPSHSGRLPRARGMATPLIHRTSHITVELCTPEEMARAEESRKKPKSTEKTAKG